MSHASSPLSEAAALARIDELAAKAEDNSPWSLGDYHRFALETVWPVGPVLVEACGVGPGQRVLDVAAGSGNVAIRAAEAGADVVACDLTRASLAAGEREARRRGVALDWVQADAEALPFADGSFDVVTSSFGAIFAPGQQAVADELVRVCGPGGLIGMANFTPEGLAGEFFGLFARFAPPPQGAASPLDWGTEKRLRELFGERVALERLDRETYVERNPGPPADYCAFFKETFGPAIAIYGMLAGEPARVAELDQAFLDFATRANDGPPGGPVAYAYEYLLVVARKAS